MEEVKEHIDEGRLSLSGLEDQHAIIGESHELPTDFNLLSLASLGLLVGIVWPACGGSIQVAIFNGGPPGVLYEFVVVSLCYATIAISLAELASAMPTSAGVYHWASITPGRKVGRVVGFFAGWWNFLAWILGSASMASIWSNSIVQLYALKHQESYEPRSWHVFLVYLGSTWLACLSVCFFSSFMPRLNKFGICWLIAGFIITIVVLVVMPSTPGRPGHATSSFVWTEWHADIGYPQGLVFLTGMLNGAYSVGCPAATSHMAEEIPSPQRNIPVAMGLQLVTGFVTGFVYLVALMYAINDYDALFTSQFPIAEIYLQATGSADGAICLLILMQICIGFSMVGLYITSGRTLWALSRDGATPIPSVLSSISSRHHMPVNATMVSAVLVTLLGCVYVGSPTAFNAIAGCYILMSSSAFIAAIVPNVITGRKNVQYGPFRLGKLKGYLLNIVASAYMVVGFVVYSFPPSLPVSAKSMNYAPLIWGGTTIFLAIFWVWKGTHGYKGPALDV